MKERLNITILGSTGSIGTQTLDVISEHSEKYKVVALTARRNWKKLAEQARKWLPLKVVITEEEQFVALKDALADLPIEVCFGEESVAYAAGMPEADVVVNALVGFSGFVPTVSAIRAGKDIALANKETLVVGGEIINSLLKEYKVRILPVDSEHSAIFQCLHGEKPNQVAKLILTASGGPFRKLSIEELKKVTVKDALAHPNWNMGAKVTIDSATMMNKGFEMIEARWLFDIEPRNIEIVVHPQSVVHSMVEYIDGSIKAQLGPTDMRFPISYALSFPDRLPTSRTPLSLHQYSRLTFEAPDREKFPMLNLAFSAIERGGNLPCILNAANEVAVEAFLNEKISFVDIPLLVIDVMKEVPFESTVTFESLLATNLLTRQVASQLLPKYQNS